MHVYDYAIINIWNGVVICACILYNKMALHTRNVNYKLEEWRLGKYFFKTGIMETHARKWNGFV